LAIAPDGIVPAPIRMRVKISFTRQNYNKFISVKSQWPLSMQNIFNSRRYGQRPSAGRIARRTALTQT
jgi:hypothetical protein